ncbi:MAG: flagellar assembly protein FliH [Pseudomonadota bacterium]
MNSSKRFSSDELGELSPWHLPDVSDPKAVPQKTALRPPFPPADEKPEKTDTAVHLRELEVLRRQVHEEAADQGYREGYEKGHREGFDAGFQDGLEEHQSQLREQSAAFLGLMESLSEPLKALDEQVEHELVSLALAVAKQLVRRELKTDPGQVVAAVREAITALPSQTRKISLHLHPDDAELVRSALALDELASAWEIIEDPLLTRGGCRVETATSRVDATHEKRLAAVIATVLGDERGGDTAS